MALLLFLCALVSKYFNIWCHVLIPLGSAAFLSFCMAIISLLTIRVDGQSILLVL